MWCLLVELYDLFISPTPHDNRGTGNITELRFLAGLNQILHKVKMLFILLKNNNS